MVKKIFMQRSTLIEPVITEENKPSVVADALLFVKSDLKCVGKVESAHSVLCKCGARRREKV